MKDHSDLIQLRKELHSYPELSGKEKSTGDKISTFMQKTNPDKVINIGQTGLAFVFDSGKNGPTILFRADMDALPIKEKTNLDHASQNTGIMHACGHDGHMTILAGLSQMIAKNRPKKGRAVLLFQPAEETGQGALQVIQDKKFETLKPDMVFALHNLPGFEENTIILKKYSFASASKGMIINLTGKTSHAAEPENGKNPANAVADIIKVFQEITHKKEQFKDHILITLIHVKIGEIAFGTSAGDAVVMATLRSYENDDMELLTQMCEKNVKRIAKKEGLRLDISYTDEFPATINSSDAIDLISSIAEKNGFDCNFVDQPFKWSEDFGHFTESFPGALFGIGAGKNHSQLHNPDYDFPDDIINTGTIMFYGIYNNYLTDL